MQEHIVLAFVIESVGWVAHSETYRLQSQTR